MRLWLALAMSFSLGAAFAQTTDDATWKARTGDAWVDAALLDTNVYAGKHRDAFVDELARYQSAPRALVEEAFSGGAMPGDVYFACAMAQALGRPCRELLDAMAADPEAGWEGVLRDLDAGHAPDALGRVKRGIVESYARWARPIQPDAVPRRQTSGR